MDYDVNTSFFAVYDGHGGHEVSEYCAKNLPDYIKNTEAYKAGDIEKALVDGYLGFDATLLQEDVIEQLNRIAQDKPPEVRYVFSYNLYNILTHHYLLCRRYSALQN